MKDLKKMIWTAWNNGRHHRSGAGYGFKVTVPDRNRYFDRSWKYIKLDLPLDSGSDTIKVNVDKPSFWDKTCRELISKEIGQWFIKHQLAPWVKRKPPKFEVAVVGQGHFELQGLSN